MYHYTIGLLDKDTKKQEIAIGKALDIVNDIIRANTEGATTYTVNGIYKHEDGTQITETSIRIETTEETPTLLDALKQLKIILNQESIMRTEYITNYNFI